MRFEWNEIKRLANLQKHRIDFLDATEIFDVPHLKISSDRRQEQRWKAIGKIGSDFVTVIYTERNEVIRLISARKARKNERKEYSELLG